MVLESLNYQKSLILIILLQNIVLHGGGQVGEGFGIIMMLIFLIGWKIN